ncbi:molybdopterin cofactor-binding domain-containing protein [Elioraea sp.]|uniref:molybdopterin cofactor-binding domain-containing protein n=1 Tax=Elioraea sp. TaxID=2185103 RepID=UPI003F700287
MNAIIDRRSILKAGGALTVAFSIGLRPRGAAAWTEKPVATDEVATFLSIDAQGAVTVHIGKVDLGTGVRTGFMQIAADELDVPMARVAVIEGDTALTPDQGPTYGSLSIQNGGVQLRAACATARRELVRLAAERLRQLRRAGRRAGAGAEGGHQRADQAARGAAHRRPRDAARGYPRQGVRPVPLRLRRPARGDAARPDGVPTRARRDRRGGGRGLGARHPRRRARGARG